jgi:electron transfer flavoprotein beta subunit
LEIVVLMKQVPSTETMVEIAPDGVSIKTADVKWVMNPYDELAVEEALQIREAQGGSVTILCLGSDKAVEAVRTALAMGADKGLLINDPAAAEADALGTARVLAAALAQMPYDLVIGGMRAVDEDHYQVGPAVAEFLKIPSITMVAKAELSDGKIRCERTLEGGTAVLETSLPALITAQRGLNTPRYASLPGIMKAKKKPLETKSLADIGLDSSALAPLTRVQALRKPPERSGGRKIEGETDEAKAAELVRILHEEEKLI